MTEMGGLSNGLAPMLMIGGCPRSGTTWLQLLLAESLFIYSRPNETHLFDVYLERLRSLFSSEKALFHSNDGLSSFFDQKSFEADLLRPFVHSVLRRYAIGAKKGQLILEKTPSNICYVEQMKELDLSFVSLEIVRDPRAVVSSWRAAQKEPWGKWAQKNIFDICATWCRYVIKGDHAKYLRKERHKRIKYELLVTKPTETLLDIYGWLGIEESKASINAAVEKCSIGRLKSEGAESDVLSSVISGRSNFIRKGEVDSWRGDLSSSDLSIIHKYCGSLMDRLGYSE
ncbi:sulfotransferase [Microbulbifer flavimaris]|uniref:Sulfotransferase n=1 Tax=Microbulbifer flavimaris TaxID=1781068 RepID=A0ABX4I3L7_9GAMM|nr:MULTISPECIES: sulfotransferase [Microbulbifer]KUJ84920.1 hypothetical protein AVO43_04590 [Microbulbifer sp. ZGT114]PCO07019.1 sulfotransferase [Microbulbifer flavimaris]